MNLNEIQDAIAKMQDPTGCVRIFARRLDRAGDAVTLFVPDATQAIALVQPATMRPRPKYGNRVELGEYLDGLGWRGYTTILEQRSAEPPL